MRISRLLTVTAATLVLAATSIMAQEEAAAPKEATGSPVVMFVNDQPLYEVEVRQIFDNLQRMVAQQGQEATQQELQNAAIDQGVGMKLLVQEANRKGIQGDSAGIDSILQGLEANAGGAEALDSGLAQNGLTRGDLRRGIEEKEIIRIYMETVIQPSINVTDEDLKTFYDANTERFNAPETVRARHILFKTGATATDEDKATARTAAAAARARAVAGEDFATLAKELSQGPSAESGGDLGFFAKEQMSPSFADAAFALDTGAISEVVETEFGFHVIKVEEKRAAGIRPLDEVAEPLRNMLTQEQMAKAVESLLASLRESATIRPGNPPTPDPASTN